MARAVYSQRFFAFAGATPVGPVGPIVPAGFVFVVRDIDAVVRSSGTAQLEILGQVVGQLIALWSYPQSPVPDNNFEWRGRQVFGVGERVGISVLSGSWDVAISGYQLTLP